MTYSFTARKSSCGKVMFHKRVSRILLMGGGGLPKEMLGYTPSPWADNPSPPSTTGYDQQAGGKNPTGIHSCCNKVWPTGENHMTPKSFRSYSSTLCVCSGRSRISQRETTVRK